MENTLYPKGKQKILTAKIDFEADIIKAILLPSTYTYSATHEFLSDLGTTLGAAQVLLNKSTTNGAFDADNPVFSALASGSIIKGIAIYKDTGVAGTSPLLVYIDEVTGLPAATNGGSVTVNSPSYIFSL